MTNVAQLLRIALVHAGRPDLANCIRNVEVFHEEERPDGLVVGLGRLLVHANHIDNMSAVRVLHEAGGILRILGVADIITPGIEFVGGPDPNMN